MTEEQLKIIRNFEVRIRQVLSVCEKLRKDNADLQFQLEQQKSANDVLREENMQIQLKYDNHKLVRMISMYGGDFMATKERLSKLVREVNICIALLNE